MPGIEKVTSGQKTKSSPLRQAIVVNAVLDAAAARQASALGGGGRPGQPLQRLTDLVKAEMAADFDRGHCVQLGAHLLTDIDVRRPWFAAATPTSSLLKCGIVHAPTPEGEIGEVHVSGRCLARVNFGSVSDTHANPVAGSLVLASGASGMFEILGPIPGAGEQETWVRFVASSAAEDPTDPTGLPAPPGYSSSEAWKKTNIDNTLANDYGLTACYGPFDLTTFSDDAAVGSRAWTDPGNAASSDDARADAGLMPSAATTTHYLKGLQMAAGYAPAATFVPKAIHVTVERRDAEDSGRVKDSAVKLVVGGAVQADNQAAAQAWPGSDAVLAYRFATTATRAQTLAADFGVVVAAVSSAGVAGSTDLAFSDDVLAPADYDSTIVLDEAGSSSVVESASGDDLQLQTTNNGTFGDFKITYSAARYTPSSWTPTGDSADARITASYDVNVTTSTSPGSVVPALFLFQDGNVYFAYLASIVVGSGWHTESFTSLTAASFAKLSGSGPATPNLGAGGAAVTFGFGSGAGVNSTWQWTAVFRDFAVTAENLPAGAARPQIDRVQVRICGVVP